MTIGKPPFRADHVGSLLRPPELLRARDRFTNGEISALELRAIGRLNVDGFFPAKLRLIVETTREVWG